MGFHRMLSAVSVEMRRQLFVGITDRADLTEFDSIFWCLVTAFYLTTAFSPSTSCMSKFTGCPDAPCSCAVRYSNHVSPALTAAPLHDHCRIPAQLVITLHSWESVLLFPKRLNCEQQSSPWPLVCGCMRTSILTPATKFCWSPVSFLLYDMIQMIFKEAIRQDVTGLKVFKCLALY